MHFAAEKHRTQRRKDRAQSPYINHPIEVAAILARHGVTDLVTLQAAILHDTVEDTDTTPAELVERFGRDVADVVAEVTDDKRLPKAVRKQLQVEHAPHLSTRARLVKLGDKISNVREVTQSPPDGWSVERRLEYLGWTEQVIAGCRGCNAELEALYDELLATGRKVIS